MLKMLNSTVIDKQTADFLKEETLVHVKEYFKSLQLSNINPEFIPMGSSGYFEIKGVAKTYLLVKKANFRLLKDVEADSLLDSLLDCLKPNERVYINTYIKRKQHKIDYIRETKKQFFDLDLIDGCTFNGVNFYIFS